MYGSMKRSDNATPDKNSTSPKFAVDGAHTPDEILDSDDLS